MLLIMSPICEYLPYTDIQSVPCLFYNVSFLEHPFITDTKSHYNSEYYDNTSKKQHSHQQTATPYVHYE